MAKIDRPMIVIRRMKKVHAAHHGGAWKVAFADFMTAMFSLFLVLWLVNQSSDVKSAIAGYFQDPLGRADEFGSSIMPGDGAQSQTVRRSLDLSDVTEVRIDRLQSVASNLEREMAASPDLAALRDQISMQMTDEGLVIELLDKEDGFFFQKGSPSPSAAGDHILALLGREMGSLPLPVRIDGHTDAFQYQNNTHYSNWELSADRANAARRIMVNHGLAIDQMSEVRAFAEKQPRAGADPYAGGNRRVTITMLFKGASAAVAAADSLTRG